MNSIVIINALLILNIHNICRSYFCYQFILYQYLYFDNHYLKYKQLPYWYTCLSCNFQTNFMTFISGFS